MAIDRIRSDKDKADDMLRQLRKAMAPGDACSALIHWLAREKRTVQHRVLDALRGPRKLGAPKNPITDKEWLKCVETWRQQMEAGAGHGRKLTELEVITDWLKRTSTRSNREANTPFREFTESGKREIKRIRDATVRAKRNRKKAAQKAGFKRLSNS